MKNIKQIIHKTIKKVFNYLQNPSNNILKRFNILFPI
jgi:hypothetical protein